MNTVIHQVDFCVIGGGLAGTCAAIAAARSGARTVLMQDRPMLGGNASSEIRMWVCGSHGENNRETGLMEEIALENLYANPEKSPYLFDCILLEKVKNEPNLTLLLNCSCLDAKCEGNRILSVTGWQGTTQTFHQVEAKLFADCSGDSILAPLSGAEFRYGREAAAEFGEEVATEVPDRKTMGNSCLIQARWEEKTSVFVPPVWAKKLTKEELAHRMPDLQNTSENFWYLELGGEQDCIADTETIRDELLALALGLWDYIKNSGDIPNADHWTLDFLGFLPAKRESRRMVGDHILTQGDVLAGGRFADTVAYGGWGLDDHDPGGFYHSGYPNTNRSTPAPYGIPYRCLYSKNVENLFFAGRNISATHGAMSSTRVMATCAVLGEAVGCAAALCAKQGVSPRTLGQQSIKTLQQTLQEKDCFLPRISFSLPDSVYKATLTCDGLQSGTLDALRNGNDRNHAIYGNEDQGCTLRVGSEVVYSLDAPTEVSAVRLVFDSDLNRTTLPGDYCERTHLTRAVTRPDSPTMHLPTTLVRSFALFGEDAQGNRFLLAEEEQNRRRSVCCSVGRTLSRLVLIPKETWGNTDSVHLFSFVFR